MAGVNRFRSVSLTQQLPITSVKNSKSDSFNNSVDELVAFLGSLQSIKREIDRELLQATTKRDNGKAESDSVYTHNLKIRLKEVNASIGQLEKRLKVLYQVNQSSDQTAIPPVSTPSPSSQEKPEIIVPVRSSQKTSEQSSPIVSRSRSNTASTFSSGENAIHSIDSIKFTNVPVQQQQQHLQLQQQHPQYQPQILQQQHQLQFQAPQQQQQQLPNVYSSTFTSNSLQSPSPFLRRINSSNSVTGTTAAEPFPVPPSIPNLTSGNSPSSKHSSLENLHYTRNRNISGDSPIADEKFHEGYESSPTWLLSDILQSLSANKDHDEYFLVSRGNDLVMLFSQYPKLKKDLVLKTFISKILFMLCHQVSEVRATGYRIARYIISDYDSLTNLVQSKILIFIIITMSRLNCDVEKEQALKLVREFINIPKGANNLSIGVIKSILAIIENEDSDPNVDDEQKLQCFKNVCIETILEIALIKTELVFLSGGFSVLFQTIKDGPSDLAMNCILCFSQILDSRDTRVFLRDGFDLSGLITIFSDIETEEPSPSTLNDTERKLNNDIVQSQQLNSSNHSKSDVKSIHKLRRAAFLVCLFLKNWNGIMAFAQQDFQSWRVLVSTLTRPHNKIRDVVLDIFFDILRIKPLPWVKNSPIGETLMKFQKVSGYSSGSFTKYSELESNTLEYSIINHYIGLLLDILVNKCNIMHILSSVIEENLNPETTKKATELSKNIYMLSYSLFPKELLNSKSLLPNDYVSIGTNITTNTMIVSDHTDSFTPTFVSSRDKLNDIRKHMHNMAIDSRYNMEESDLKDKIARSKVLTVKEYEEWNWTQLSEIIQGPLRNPKKFEDIVKNVPKFLKRIMSFYRPFKFRFCNTMIKPTSSKKLKGDNIPSTHIYVTVGCQLFEALLSTDEGIKYLSSNKILAQLSETFAQVDPFSGIEAKEPILSRKRLRRTLSYGYIDFVGTLSKDARGLKILNQWQFFTMFHHILEGSVLNIGKITDKLKKKSLANANASNDADINDSSYNYNHSQFLIILLLSKLDFTIDSPLRIILSKALSICTLEIKIFIIETVLIDKLIKVPECEKWVIKMLVQRLYDTNEVIRTLVIDTLYTFCNISVDNLKYVISLKPSIGILKKSTEGNRGIHKGESIIMLFLSTSQGFKYLDDIGYIDQEFSECVDRKNKEYAIKVSFKLEETLFPYILRSKNWVTNRNTKGDLGNEIEPMPMHFFSHLLQTEEGLLYFQQYQNKQYLDNLISDTNLIKIEIESRYNGVDAPLQLDDESLLNQVQSMLFTLKENLWILGNIAGSKYGIQLLDPEYSRTLSVPIIPIIIDLVSNFPFWHVRGVALYQLGRIASTVEGTEILDELNWISTFDRFDKPKSICFPNGENRLKNMFNVEVTNPYKDIKYYTIFGVDGSTNVTEGGVGDGAMNLYRNNNGGMVGYVDGLDDYELFDQSVAVNDNNIDSTYLSEEDIQKYQNRVLTLIIYLSAILGRIERKATKELVSLKQSFPELFASPSFFSKVIKLIDKGKYKLRVRRIVFNMFLDSRILENLVKKHKKR
ncbi:hypothetical protein CLIB1423_08S03664 [[Candida] railenensis]|uniref:REM-1 domain-containing protein n=1 Tax=[Candida] railenensis TaxID=45579 RepID=A0A9P0VYU5_9ASCO|nr:hypothetical protein CLIB1423_08S03664 [[Candida] railenensis]